MVVRESIRKRVRLAAVVMVASVMFCALWGNVGAAAVFTDGFEGSSLPVTAQQAMGVNIALNAAASGYPSPLQSDPGWGGGAKPWEILDGKRAYPVWQHGLAFAWDDRPHQATIDFGTMETFEQVVLWHHGHDNVPTTIQSLDYYDGTAWNSISLSRTVGEMIASPGYGAISDNYLFDAPVTGSRVRWSFDGGQPLSFYGQTFIHGWLYEFEVYDKAISLGTPVPEPSAVLIWSLMGLCFLGMGRYRRRKVE